MTCIPEKPPEGLQCGLSHLYWNKVLDSYIDRKGMFSEDFEDMDLYQKYMIHELDKHFARLKAKDHLE